MNIYDFIYCFIRRSYDRTDGSTLEKGELDGAPLPVVGTFFFHIVFLTRVIELALGRQMVTIPRVAGSESINKLVAMAVCFVIYLIVSKVFYKRERCEKLLEEYQKKYGNNKTKRVVLFLLIMVVPLILFLMITSIRSI